MKELFKGSCVALITPFKKGEIDYEKLNDMIDFQVLSGTSAILILGTTGESSTITYSERKKMIEFCRKIIPRKCKFLVGTGSNSTRVAMDLSREAEQLGADGLLVVTPYYNKCNQEGLFEHYKQISECINIPIILYNVPSRTGVNIEPETAEKLSILKNIYGIKEANSNIEHITRILKTLKNKIAVYSGNDDLNFYFLDNGGSGVISVTANLFPELVNEVCKNYFDGNVKIAKEIHENLSGINKALFVDVNPIPVKFGAGYLKYCDDELRLPLTNLSSEKQEIVKSEIDKIKL